MAPGDLTQTGLGFSRDDIEGSIVPQSIAFFHSAGLDYVSCSPFGVPVARVAAAQAAVASPVHWGDHR